MNVDAMKDGKRQMKLYNKTIKTVTQLSKMGDTEGIVVCTSVPGMNVELIRWPYYDVEIRIDDRQSKKIGMTGKNENVLKVRKTRSVKRS